MKKPGLYSIPDNAELGIIPKYNVILEFEAYTPVWTGGPTGYSREPLDGRGDLSFGPTAQSIIGVARWLLRSTGPCKKPRLGGGAGHRECDLAASRAFGAIGMSSPVTVHVSTEGLEPIVSRRVVNSLESLLNIIKKVSRAEAKGACGRSPSSNDSGRSLGSSDLYKALQVIGLRIIRSEGSLFEQSGSVFVDYLLGNCKGKSGHIGKKLKHFVEKTGEGRILALLMSIPRVFQASLDKSPEELYRMLPHRPGHKLRVEVWPRSWQKPDWAALSLATASIAVSLLVIGVGKASSRGFGRYLIKRFRLPKNMDQGYKDLVEHILQAAIARSRR